MWMVFVPAAKNPWYVCWGLWTGFSLPSGDKAKSGCYSGRWFWIFLQHYHLADKNGYSGTAILSKQEPLSVVEDFPNGEHAGEGRTITCEYDGPTVNVYVPNSKNDLSRLEYRYECWDPDLRNYLLTLQEKAVILAWPECRPSGDRLANPTSNHNSAGFTDEEREGMLIFSRRDFWYLPPFVPRSNRCLFLVELPGWCCSRNVGWRIDYFVVSEDLATSVREATIHSKIEGSDHVRLGWLLLRATSDFFQCEGVW